MANNLTLTSPTFGASDTGFGQKLTGGYGATGANVSLTPPFTIEARLSGTGSGTQVALGNSGSFGWFGLFNGNFGGFMGTGSGAAQFSTTGVSPDGNTHELAMVVPDGSPANVRFYIDGVSYAATSSSGSQLINTASPFGVRADNTGNYPFSGSVDEVRFSNIARYGGNYAPATTPFSVDANTVSLYHLDGDGTDAALASVHVAPNDPAIVYSPANWSVTSSLAITINGGAYGRIVVSDPNPVLNFDVSKMVPNAKSQISWRLDGGPWNVVDIAATIACMTSADTTAQSKHLLEWAAKATTEFVVPSQPGQRWDPTSSPNTAIVFTGLTLAGGSTVGAPQKASLNGVVFGDSITEGFRNISGTAATDVIDSDSLRGWAFDLRRQLGAEIGVVGFGGQGWGGGGVGSVPAFGAALGYFYSGAARTFTGLDFVVIAHGENDSTNNVTAQITSALNAIIAAVPSACAIYVLRPFSGKQAANLQAGIAACSAPSRVAYCDTTGTDVTGYDGVHPYASSNLITNGPLVASIIRTAAPSVGAVQSTDIVQLTKSGTVTPTAMSAVKTFLNS